MDDKVLPDEPLSTRTAAGQETVDLPEGSGFFNIGQVLGDRYEVLEMLGRGGMGEVWRAFDLKLRVEVALKALRQDLRQSDRRLQRLRQEVRTARDVISPNVCRIFDLIEIEDRELVSMEYVDGATLLGVLRERGPLKLNEAQDIASQFLAGLEAIHNAGLVHRDIKPENIMLTRAGRVVVMDFGIARHEIEGGGSCSGTPAYMAPEHAAGQEVDARADVYSAGVVLAEMVSPDGIKSYASRQSVWEGVRSEPAQVPDSPWAPVIKRAVARDREHRQNSAHTLIRELEDVTLRVEGAEDLHPYPGMASFTEENAEYFFGRETEVEALWSKLDRPHLLAIVGPSGAGKTSFIRAGVLPAAPADWAHVVCTPGNAAISSLARPMAHEMAGDAELMEQLLSFDNPDVAVEVYSSWREKHAQAVLVVDQFEELFTLNPPEVQSRVAELLGRFVLEADVCVVLSMRDDFLMRCRDLEPLRPIFSELTALPTLAGSALRRALVQPATTCGYRFEDDELVEEMLAEVEGERGALPMLAFAAARLWEKRDRDNGLLTRQVYQDIGGVGGALARHAEATIDRIGLDRVPIVREIFRNLVTAEGTRAVREVDELLSVFDGNGREGINPSPTTIATTPAQKPVAEGFIPSRDAALDVLHKLIDARLLTSYEIQEEEQEPSRQVEIVHESLLNNWPRLVRWQTQDTDAAQLRDQLRQAAQTWREHERSDDLLWTGSAYREFTVWRERYPGGLSDTEEAFGEAMTRHAERRRRRRRTAVAATFAVLLVVLAVIGGFWRRSVSEAQRAEAANLISLGRVQLEDYPTGALAHAIASLELAEDLEARRLALEALWRGPTEFKIPTRSPYSVDFSPDGRWLLTSAQREGGLLWPSDGGHPTALEKKETTGEGQISPTGNLIAFNMGWNGTGRIGLWSFPDGRFLRLLRTGGQSNQNFRFSQDGTRLIAATTNTLRDTSEAMIRAWPLGGGEPELLDRLNAPKASAGLFVGVDPTESHLAWVDGTNLNITALKNSKPGTAHLTSLRHDRALSTAVFDDRGQQLATADGSGKITVWSLRRDPPERTHTFATTGFPNPYSIRFDPSGTRIGTAEGYLCDLSAAPDSEPLNLKSVMATGYGAAFHPEGTWLARGGGNGVSLCPLTRSYPQVILGHETYVESLHFSPDGERIVSLSEAGNVRLWPLDARSGRQSRILFQPQGPQDFSNKVAMAPDGSFFVMATWNGSVYVIPLDGGPSRELTGFTDRVGAVAVDPQSRIVAAAGATLLDQQRTTVRIWDLVSQDVRVFDNGGDNKIGRLDFTEDGDLWVTSGPKLCRWDLTGDDPQIVETIDLSSPEFANSGLCDFDPNRRRLLLWKPEALVLHDLGTRQSRELSSHAGSVSCALDSTGDIVLSTDAPGAVRASPATGGEAHLLLGHGPCIKTVAASPDGRWIASGGCDKTIRLWPMPDLSKPPLHTLPREQLIAKLKTVTNIRVVRDEESPTGWKIDTGPFPGWETVPEW